LQQTHLQDFALYFYFQVLYENANTIDKTMRWPEQTAGHAVG